MTVKRTTWEALYRAASRFHALKPWEWMSDADVFGVQNPEDGEIGYCCILGALGQQLALNVYLGAEGLAGMMALANREDEVVDIGAFLSTQKCLMASFEDRKLLDEEDIGVISSLGLKFRGRKAWPQFRSYRPGYAPWYLTENEARFLTVALEQACEFTPQFKGTPDFLGLQNELNDYQLWVTRVPKVKKGAIAWENEVFESEPFERPLVLAPPPDTARLHEVAAAGRRSSAVWQIELFMLPGAVKEETDERPWYPTAFLCLDDASGYLFGIEIARAPDIASAAIAVLLNAIGQAGAIPAKILVCSEQAEALLAPSLAVLQVELERVEELPEFREAVEGLYEYMP